MSEKHNVSKDVKSNALVFQKINYLIFILSIIIVIIGFFLMMGTEDIYSFSKITLAPLVIVAGFALGFVAILIKPRKTQ